MANPLRWKTSGNVFRLSDDRYPGSDCALMTKKLNRIEAEIGLDGERFPITIESSLSIADAKRIVLDGWLQLHPVA